MSDSPNKKRSSGPRHIWSVLCQSSAIDRDSNTVSLFHAVENITLDKSKWDQLTQGRGESGGAAPLAVQMELVSLWGRGDLENRVSEVKMVLLDPADQSLNEKIYKLVFQKNRRRMRIRIKISGIDVTDPGLYTFRLSCRSSQRQAFQAVAEIPLELTVRSK